MSAVGPLKGLRVLEFAGLAPGPFCGMLLADFGASVDRVDRPGVVPLITDRLSRGKRSICVDMKKAEGRSVVVEMAKRSDVLIDPFRPGVLEKLKLGPNDLSTVNSRLIFARISGYGQTGPWSDMAGHDINYMALSGVLSLLGRAGEKPHAPLNLVADFAGGGLMCAFGILAALLERQKSGLGQVVDASMTEGAAYVASYAFATRKEPFWGRQKGENVLDGGNPIYDTYKTKDEKYISVGPLEPNFHVLFLEKLGLDFDSSTISMELFQDTTKWKQLISNRIRAKTRDEWTSIFEGDKNATGPKRRNFLGTDACVAPVLSLSEVGGHKHHVERNSFFADKLTKLDEPSPSPRLSRTPGKGGVDKPIEGQHTRTILNELGYSAERIESMENDATINPSVQFTASKL